MLWWLLALRVAVPEGSHAPFYPPTPELEKVAMPAFMLDDKPVTNAQYLAFVKANPEWAKGAISPLFAESGYLASWMGPRALGSVDPQAPVVSVSWHAARAYCQAQGGDLPTSWQWEYAADATQSAPTGARKDPETLQQILNWYAAGGSALPGPVGQGEPNHFGLYDMHGLIWEWTLDFDALPVTGDARDAGDAERLRFCGAGAVSAADTEDYASFMRLAFRDSLEADYATSNLGFRCASSL
jgi:formylglycine-generating enzyme required for sulfatase activity